MKPFDLEEYLKNPNRKIVTRVGNPVRILAIDLEDKDFPIAAAIDNRYPLSYTSRGTRNYELRYDDENDLFFDSEKHEGWANLYRCALDIIYAGCVYTSEKEAKEHIDNPQRYVATVKIEWEE